MGAASCVVGLSRWFSNKERGSYYGFWSASHNIGEALAFITVASIVSVLGWRYGFLGAGIVGLIGVLIIWNFLFFSYAVGKFTNGFLADRSNINRFMSTGLLVSALVNLCLGFIHSFILFAAQISEW